MRKESKVIEGDYMHYMSTSPIDAQSIDEWHQSKVYDNEIGFVGILYNTSLVASTSIFEAVLKNVCKYGAYKNHRTFIDPRMPVVQNCKDFLKKIGVDLDKTDLLWERINLVLQVRNLIIHHGATYQPIVFNPKDKEIVKHIESKREFVHIKKPRTKKTRPFLIIDEQYIKDFVNDCEKYLLVIIEQLPERRRKVSRRINIK